MFTWRYHVASLAAVFFALAVGILLGVAISGKVSEATESLSAGEQERLRQELTQLRERAELSDRRREAAEDALESAYPALMEGRLEDNGFAILFLGHVEGDVRSAVERTLTDAGSGQPVRLVALDAPIDADELGGMLVRNDSLAVYADGEDDFTELGAALAGELIAGGDTPLWSTLSGALVEERAGPAAVPVDGAVVVASWRPPTDGIDESEEARPTVTLVEGLLEGLRATGFPVVGVETSSVETEESQIDLYRGEGISSVDNIDTLAGRVALALLLAGAQPGHYGLKDSASEGVAPPIDSLPEEGSGG